MTQPIRRILRLIFTIIGSLACLLGVGVLVMLKMFGLSAADTDALWGGVIYLTIAVVCFIAVWRLRPPRQIVRGFEVVMKEGERA